MNVPKTFSKAERGEIWQQVMDQAALQGRMNQELELLLKADPEPEPSLRTKFRSLTRSLSEWAAAGFKVVSQEQFDTRINECRICPHWDPDAMRGTGKCRKCGCSTQAKLRLATAKCPIGKW
jgi:hypothetical protein